MHQLESSFYQHLQHLNLTSARVILAVSGGSDSVALLRLMLALQNTLLQKPLELSLKVGHFHHHIRPHECQRDADFTVDMCQQLNIDCTVAEANIPRIAKAKGMNQEATSRQLRYTFLHKIAKEFSADYVITAHTQDDQAETVLMQMMRGSAFPKGMRTKHGHLLRPLLPFSRQTLQDYLQDIEQPYMVDTTNFDESFTRAWLRHTLLPLWQQRQPNIKAKLARLAHKQQGYADYFDAAVEPWFTDLAHDITWLKRNDHTVQRHALAALLQKQNIAIDDTHLDAALETLNNHRTHSIKRISMPQHHYLRLGYDDVHIFDGTQQTKNRVTHTTALATLPPEIDADKINNFAHVVMRHRQSGDRIQLEQGSKSLKQLLIDKKIPRENRDSLKVIASGQDVLWVEGIAVDSRVRNTTFRSDAYWMGLALAEANKAFDKGEVPVGAVIVQDNTLIARAHNLSETRNDPSAHAEVLALRMAAEKLEDWRLLHCRLYVTLEPCMMCLGTVLQAHVGNIIYGASNPREGALGGVAYLQQHNWKRKLEITRGVRAKEARELLQHFFQQQRNATHQK